MTTSSRDSSAPLQENVVPSDAGEQTLRGGPSSAGSSSAGPLSAGPAPVKKRSQRKRTWKRRLGYRLAVPLAHAILSGLRLTRRSERAEGLEHLEGLLAADQNFVVSAWHDQAFLCSAELLRRVPDKGRLTYLVSPSVDGDPVSMWLEGRGAHVVRGSATRSAVTSLRKLYRSMTSGAIPVVFSDGPTGPAREFKAGGVLLSQMSGSPILPMAVALDREWRLGTWDRIRLAKPRAAMAVVFGEPVIVPQPFPESAGLQAWCTAEAERLNALERRAQELLAEGA